MELTELVVWAVGLVVAIVAPAVGWLITAVIGHRAQIAALAEAQRSLPSDLRELVRQNSQLAVSVAQVGGDIKVMRERTDALLRTVDRHERFLFAVDSRSRSET